MSAETRKAGSRKVDAVIFDLDGLILDTERIAKRFWLMAFKEFGVVLTDEQYLGIVGRNVRDSNMVLRNLLGDDFPVEECRARMRETYYEDIARNGLPVKPGVHELVDFLKMKSLRYAVATSTARDITMRKLELTNLVSSFETVVAGDEVSHGKPHPEIFLKAAALLDAQPRAVVVLEDSFSGIRAAKAAGMIPIMVPDLAQPTEEIQSLAYAVVSTLSEAKEIIEEILGRTTKDYSHGPNT
ncbi:MAG: HAD family phosphatase [Candidatus Abyssobacteria bacterium SURF_5]|uniref:HAD family phosphatase n=1 Tax=Abyssobacteria bacterium (strain SURF_5) TaxID=2093360 RepID=A0A3A4P093_ABYX5|nr:MAG: HAD family phosphatase [Candidatus Abyssubacteria bacterium SURF_5]